MEAGQDPSPPHRTEDEAAFSPEIEQGGEDEVGHEGIKNNANRSPSPSSIE